MPLRHTALRSIQEGMVREGFPEVETLQEKEAGVLPLQGEESILGIPQIYKCHLCAWKGHLEEVTLE